MDCPKCGKQYSSNEVPPFCTSCGEPLGAKISTYYTPKVPSPKKKISKGWMIGIIGALVLLVVIALAVVLPLTLIKPMGPSATFLAFVKALDRGDFATAHSYLTAKDAANETSSDIRDYWAGDQSGGLVVQKEEISGDEAQLTVLNKSSGDMLYYPCYKENGKWKIALSEYTDNSNDNSNGSGTTY